MLENIITELPEDIYNDTNPYSPEGAKLFDKYCKDNSIYYYASPNESFDTKQAITNAEELGLTTLFLDNLSWNV